MDSLNQKGRRGARGSACWAGRGALVRGESGLGRECGPRGRVRREKNGLGRFGLRLSLGRRRKEVAGWAAHGFGAGLAVGLV